MAVRSEQAMSDRRGRKSCDVKRCDSTPRHSAAGRGFPGTPDDAPGFGPEIVNNCRAGARRPQGERPGSHYGIGDIERWWCKNSLFGCSRGVDMVYYPTWGFFVPMRGKGTRFRTPRAARQTPRAPLSNEFWGLAPISANGFDPTTWIWGLDSPKWWRRREACVLI